jgi:heptosyltransferase-1
VADALAADGITSVVVGAPSDAPLAAEIAAAAESPIVDLTGKTTLKQLADLFRRCRAVISNDTGPMYLASAVGAPTAAIFGPTDSTRLGPYGDGNVKITPQLPCRPCRRRSCQPLKCMDAVSVEQVVDAVLRIIRPSVPGGGPCRPANANQA